jgi:hypothetical protein
VLFQAVGVEGKTTYNLHVILTNVQDYVVARVAFVEVLERACPDFSAREIAFMKAVPLSVEEVLAVE